MPETNAFEDGLLYGQILRKIESYNTALRQTLSGLELSISTYGREAISKLIDTHLSSVQTAYKEGLDLSHKYLSPREFLKTNKCLKDKSDEFHLLYNRIKEKLTA